MAGSNKRPWQSTEGDDEGGEPPRELKRWRPIILEVMGAEFLQRLLKKLEPILRRVVREEIEKGLANSGLSNPRLPMNQKPRARYRLRFQNDLPETLYTWDKLKSKDGKDVEIAIFDTVLNCTVISAPWSSVKVEVVVLKDGFPSDEQESWSKEEFSKHVEYAREGKRPLLLGEVVIKLNQGVGYLTDIKFTDNSAWRRTQKFRLALRLHKNEDNEVDEGISGCFRVKEGRVKPNEKHHPPSPTDEVYYLDGIRRDGPIHNRLLNGGVSTVQQLLRAYHTDTENLRWLIGGKRGQGTWEAIIKHASDCRPGDELYSYDITEQGVKLIFNSIFQLQGVYCGDTLYETSVLTFQQQSSLQSLKEQTFQNLDKIKLFIPAVVGSIPNPPQQTFPSSAQETSSFIMQHPSGGWNSTQVFPNQEQCGNEVPYGEFAQDPCAQSSSQFSQLFTLCQEASTSMVHSDPVTDQMNHLREEDIAEWILEYRRPELVRHWAKAITKLRFVIHIDKNLSIRRSKMFHFDIERFK